jgi:2-oxoglutarate ferredoxin oxidoreductase subunit gamma
VKREDVHAFYIPANIIAEEAGGGKAANIAMIGAFLAVTGVATRDVVKDSLKEVISKRNLKYLDINYKALDLGYDYVRR